jgi:hypothetical protein
MSTVRDRVRVHRERRKTGKAVVPFVVVDDALATVEVLIAVRLLDESDADDVAAVSTAVGRLVDMLVKEHTNRSLER